MNGGRCRCSSEARMIYWHRHAVEIFTTSFMISIQTPRSDSNSEKGIVNWWAINVRHAADGKSQIENGKTGTGWIHFQSSQQYWIQYRGGLFLSRSPGVERVSSTCHKTFRKSSGDKPVLSRSVEQPCDWVQARWNDESATGLLDRAIQIAPYFGILYMNCGNALRGASK